MNESASPQSQRSSASEWQPVRKRGRRDASEDDGDAGQSETDLIQTKRPRVRGRTEGNPGDRPLPQRVKPIRVLPDSILTPISGRSYL